MSVSVLSEWWFEFKLTCNLEIRPIKLKLKCNKPTFPFTIYMIMYIPYFVFFLNVFPEAYHVIIIKRDAWIFLFEQNQLNYPFALWFLVVLPFSFFGAGRGGGEGSGTWGESWWNFGIKTVVGFPKLEYQEALDH